MYSPSLALLWQTWGRHRWGLGVVLAGLLGLIALHRALPANLLLSEIKAVLFTVPVGCAFVYVFYAFSYADLGPRARGSGIPAWMFTLPVRTWMLVAWPMLSGSVAIALLWWLVAGFILNPVGLDLPLGWPALGLAVTLAWVQAVDWSPVGAPAKTLAAGLGLAALWYGLTQEPYQEITPFLLPLLLLLTYLIAVVGVQRARRGGSVTAGHTRFRGFHLAFARRAYQTPYASPARAQLWLECRRNSLLLPAVVGCWLLFFTMLLTYEGDAHAVVAFIISDLYLLPVLCILVGAALGKGDVWARPFRLSAFAATRPLGTGAMVLAKFQMAAWSVLLSGTLVVVVSLAWCAWKWSPRALGDIWEQSFPYQTGAVVGAMLLMGTIGYFGFCWLQLAGHLWVGLTGRFWVFAGVMIFYLVGVPNFLVVESGWELAHPEAARSIAAHQLWLACGAILVKFLLAAWTFARGYRCRLWSGAALAGILAFWLLTVISLGVFYGWTYVNRSGNWAAIPVHQFANTLALLVLFSPLTRLAVAPLALTWNRHRKAA
jgi:hypothetical protein